MHVLLRQIGYSSWFWLLFWLLLILVLFSVLKKWTLLQCEVSASNQINLLFGDEKKLPGSCVFLFKQWLLIMYFFVCCLEKNKKMQSHCGESILRKIISTLMVHTSINLTFLSKYFWILSKYYSNILEMGGIKIW